VADANCTRPDVYLSNRFIQRGMAVLHGKVEEYLSSQKVGLTAPIGAPIQSSEQITSPTAAHRPSNLRIMALTTDGLFVMLRRKTGGCFALCTGDVV
jgi:hypothetical protein